MRKLDYVWAGFMVKRKSNLETYKTENFGLEITVCKKKRCILFYHLPPNFAKTKFFDNIFLRQLTRP